VTKLVGVRFRCQNPDCGCEVEVINDSSEAESNPRCSCCGSAMKKPYQKPFLKNLGAESKKLAHLFEDTSPRQSGARLDLWRCPSKHSTSDDTPTLRPSFSAGNPE